jgi:hypothetical protein
MQEFEGNASERKEGEGTEGYRNRKKEKEEADEVVKVFSE